MCGCGYVCASARARTCAHRCPYGRPFLCWCETVCRPNKIDESAANAHAHRFAVKTVRGSRHKGALHCCRGRTSWALRPHFTHPFAFNIHHVSAAPFVCVCVCAPLVCACAKGRLPVLQVRGSSYTVCNTHEPIIHRWGLQDPWHTYSHPPVHTQATAALHFESSSVQLRWPALRLGPCTAEAREGQVHPSAANSQKQSHRN